MRKSTFNIFMAVCVLAVGSVVTAGSVQADNSVFTCSAGTPGEDSHSQVTIYEDGLRFDLHETTFTVDAADVNFSENTLAVVGKRIKFSGEGETWFAVVSALLVLNKANTGLNATLLIDGGPTLLTGTKMTCTQQQS